LAQKQMKVGREVLLDLYCDESCFWAKVPLTFGPLVGFCKRKAKAGSWFTEEADESN
jgi:hypothetical protein